MGVEIPQRTVEAVIAEHGTWQKQMSKRSPEEYRKYKSDKQLSYTYPMVDCVMILMLKPVEEESH